jgi:hypothetical protein
MKPCPAAPDSRSPPERPGHQPAGHRAGQQERQRSPSMHVLLYGGYARKRYREAALKETGKEPGR